MMIIRFGYYKFAATGFLLLVVMLLLSACGQSAQEGGEASPVLLPLEAGVSESVGQVVSPSESVSVRGDDIGVKQESLETPLKAYVLGSEQHRVLHRAENALTVDCMSEHGYNVSMPDPPLEPVWDMTYRRYAPVTESKIAAQYGYHQVPRSSNPEPDWVEDEEKQQVFSDCVSRVRDQLGDGLDMLVDGGANRPDLVTDIYFDHTPAESSQVKKAQRQWSKCMAQQGYTGLEDTLADRSILAPSTGGSTPGESEIEMALTDVECQVKTKVIEIWVQAETDYQNMMIDRQAEAFAKLKQQNETLMKRVAKVLQEH